MSQATFRVDLRGSRHKLFHMSPGNLRMTFYVDDLEITMTPLKLRFQVQIPLVVGHFLFSSPPLLGKPHHFGAIRRFVHFIFV